MDSESLGGGTLCLKAAVLGWNDAECLFVQKILYSSRRDLLPDVHGIMHNIREELYFNPASVTISAHIGFGLDVQPGFHTDIASGKEFAVVVHDPLHSEGVVAKVSVFSLGGYDPFEKALNLFGETVKGKLPPLNGNKVIDGIYLGGLPAIFAPQVLEINCIFS